MTTYDEATKVVWHLAVACKVEAGTGLIGYVHAYRLLVRRDDAEMAAKLLAEANGLSLIRVAEPVSWGEA